MASEGKRPPDTMTLAQGGWFGFMQNNEIITLCCPKLLHWGDLGQQQKEMDIMGDPEEIIQVLMERASSGEVIMPFYLPLFPAGTLTLQGLTACPGSHYGSHPVTGSRVDLGRSTTYWHRKMWNRKVLLIWYLAQVTLVVQMPWPSGHYLCKSQCFGASDIHRNKVFQ